MSSSAVSALLGEMAPDQTEFGDLNSGIVLPIIDSVNLISSGEVQIARENFVCLCRQEQFVLIWGDTVENMIVLGTDIETWLVGLVSRIQHQ